MNRALALCVLAAAPAGCFYTESINAPPQAQIEQLDPMVVYQGEPVYLSARKSSDPDGDSLTFRWTATRCQTPQACTAFAQGRNRDFELIVPSKELLMVGLEVTDSHGAVAGTSLALVPVNRAPQVDAQVTNHPGPSGGFTLGRTLKLVAQASDPDQGDTVTLTWDLFPPVASNPMDVVFERVSATEYRLTPDVTGQWQVRVTASDNDATDPLAATDTVTLLIVPDEPPCVSTTSPPPTGGLPHLLFRADPPRRFRAETVEDDLDPYPYPEGSSDGDLGGARFRWLVRRPGTSPWQILPGNDGAELLVDPAAYAPGDRLGVRLEVADRNLVWPACPAGEAACSARTDGCTQRVTWEVEVR